MDSNCRYDLKGFSDDLGLPLQDIADLFSDFIKEIKSEIVKIRTFLAKRDLNELGRINHNIKGISVNYRVLDIHDETLKISIALKTGDFKYIEPLFNNFFLISENAVQEITCYFERKGIVVE